MNNESLLKLMSEVKAVDFILAVILVFALYIVFKSQQDKINKYLNKWRKKENQKEDFKDLVFQTNENVKELSKHFQEHTRDYQELKDNVYKRLDSQSEQIKELRDMTIEIQKKNSETKRAEIKEKIERIYRECTLAQTCTKMQFETLKDLIDQYEKHGGVNSFVHTNVLPEMYHWRQIDKLSNKEEYKR